MRNGIAFRVLGGSNVPCLAFHQPNGDVLVVHDTHIVSGEQFDREYSTPHEESGATIAAQSIIDSNERARAAVRAAGPRNVTGNTNAAVQAINDATERGVTAINDALARFEAMMSRVVPPAVAATPPASAPATVPAETPVTPIGSAPSASATSVSTPPAPDAKPADSGLVPGLGIPGV